MLMKRILLLSLLTILAITAKSQTVNGIHYYKMDDSHVSVTVESEWDRENSQMIYLLSNDILGVLVLMNQVDGNS